MPSVQVHGEYIRHKENVTGYEQTGRPSVLRTCVSVAFASHMTLLENLQIIGEAGVADPFLGVSSQCMANNALLSCGCMQGA